ncbi:MAG: ABC transporter permease [Oscillospiraceae bacterium]
MCMFNLRKRKEVGENQSKERIQYLHKVKMRNNTIYFTRWAILIIAILLWEIMARIGIIDAFIMSQPSRILKTMLRLGENDLLYHLGITLYETLMGFLLGVILGILFAIVLWWSEFIAKISEPYLVVLNSLPKIALGPVIIIWVGAGQKAIIFMALAISLIVTILEMLGGFLETEKEKIIMAKTLGANKAQIFKKIVFPSNMSTLFNSLKINIGLSLVGVIAGEFLVSKGGLGYLIVYGGQVFKMDLVMTGVIILAIMAALMYQVVVMVEKFVTKKMSHN